MNPLQSFLCLVRHRHEVVGKVALHLWANAIDVRLRLREKFIDVLPETYSVGVDILEDSADVIHRIRTSFVHIRIT